MRILKLAASTAAASVTLEDWGPVGLPLSDPPCRLRGMKFMPAADGGPEVGVWECSPGRYRRQIRNAEAIHVVAGQATFTPDDGPPVRLGAGDVFHFAADTMGVWEIVIALRKVYVLFALD